MIQLTYDEARKIKQNWRGERLHAVPVPAVDTAFNMWIANPFCDIDKWVSPFDMTVEQIKTNLQCEKLYYYLED